MIAQFFQSVLQGMPAGPGGQQYRAGLNTHILRTHDLVGAPVFEHAVNMDAGTMCESISADNRFVNRNGKT